MAFEQAILDTMTRFAPFVRVSRGSNRRVGILVAIALVACSSWLVARGRGTHLEPESIYYPRVLAVDFV